MATYYKRKGKRGFRWTARVRVDGRETTKTFATKGAAETWARAQEVAIESGEFRRPSQGVIFADLVDLFLEHRATIARPLGKTATNTIARLKAEHGMESPAAMDKTFWRRHALRRMGRVDRTTGRKPTSQTATQDLLYAASVLKHAQREGVSVNATAPSEARDELAGEGLRVSSRAREQRISDKQLAALLAWIDANEHRTHVPLGDIVRFALATAMRRGEIVSIRHEDINERVILVRNRKHPRDHERVDRVPLMKAHPLWPRDDPLEIIKRQPTKSGRIFPYLADTAGFWFERACEGAKLDGVVFHLLRHESLSRYAGRGLDLLRLQLIGGHRDIRHLQRYAKIDPEVLANE